jgi:hypothetical protein
LNILVFERTKLDPIHLDSIEHEGQISYPKTIRSGITPWDIDESLGIEHNTMENSYNFGHLAGYISFTQKYAVHIRISN